MEATALGWKSGYVHMETEPTVFVCSVYIVLNHSPDGNGSTSVAEPFLDCMGEGEDCGPPRRTLLRDTFSYSDVEHQFKGEVFFNQT